MYVTDVGIHVTRAHLGLLLSHPGDGKKRDLGNKIVASLSVSGAFSRHLLEPAGRSYCFLDGFFFFFEFNCCNLLH